MRWRLVVAVALGVVFWFIRIPPLEEVTARSLTVIGRGWGLTYSGYVAGYPAVRAPLSSSAVHLQMGPPCTLAFVFAAGLPFLVYRGKRGRDLGRVLLRVSVVGLGVFLINMVRLMFNFALMLADTPRGFRHDLPLVILILLTWLLILRHYQQQHFAGRQHGVLTPA